MGRVPVNATLPLGLLLSTDAVCSTTLLGEFIPRAAAVIHRLRRSGYVIGSRPCSQNHDHASPQIEYHLEPMPEGECDDA